MKRRHFIGAIALGTGGLAVGWGLWPARQRLLPSKPLPSVASHPAFNGWVRIGEDDRVTVVMGRSEMGQGSHTGLAMLLADELGARWDQVQIEQAPFDNIYNNQAVAADGLPFHPDNQGQLKRAAQFLTGKTMREFGLMMTGGSSSIKDLWLPMREAGASARAMLAQAAAAKWQLPVNDIVVADGVVSHASGRSARFGELALLAAQQTRPDTVTLKTPAQFKLIGHPIPRLETIDKVNGSAIFGSDVRPPGLLFACVGMNPELGGSYQSLDDAVVKTMPGVKKALAVPPLYGSTTAVAVVAQTTYQAMQGLRKLPVEWSPGKASDISDATVQTRFKEALDSNSGFTYFSEGDADRAIAASKKTVQAEYSAPYLAHAAMEPLTCTVWFKDGAAEVWASTQITDLARHVVAKVLGISSDKVQLHLTLLGGGFGRRLEMDVIAQAAFIAKACEGSPVQTLWDRTQDLQHDFYRPAAASRFTAALDDNGQLTAWHNLSASQAVLPQVLSRLFGLPAAGPDKTTAEGAFDQAYEWPNAKISHCAVDLPIPVGFWRSVGHSHQAFFKESFVDEVAHAAGQDAVAFRLSLLKNHPRHAKVLQTVAEKSGWKPSAYRAPDGSQRAMGLALHESFGSIVAQVVELSVLQQKIKVHRVWCVIDCGTAINPDLIAQQMEGSVAFGLSAALYGRIQLNKGRVQQSNFHDYPILRMPDMPKVDTFIIPSDATPEGVGEPGTPPVAPAVANALFTLTGQRLRSLPFVVAAVSA
ncbi:MAG: xanthine dehydrogenase family protein molybdopterin-binding subunit [Betaproteobacteria bacterium]|nr:xanthine dehydrogenase family protein molybdopterin-binding subunit [Betaproteobacteria bacterium]